MRIRINIGKKKYKGYYNWEDIPLYKFIELAEIPIPDAYRTYILTDGKFSVDNIDQYIAATAEITEKQIEEEFPEYYRKVINCLTNIPLKVIHTLTLDQVSQIYEYYLKPFVVTLIYHAPVIQYFNTIKDYEPPVINKFRIGLNTYYLPETVNIMDQEIPLAKEPIISYTEAADVFKTIRFTQHDIRRLALFMAIYCRKKGEAYDQYKALRRQELFMRLPMSVVWGVFFCTAKQLPDFMLIILLFGELPKSIREKAEQAREYKNMVVVD